MRSTIRGKHNKNMRIAISGCDIVVIWRYRPFCRCPLKGRTRPAVAVGKTTVGRGRKAPSPRSLDLRRVSVTRARHIGVESRHDVTGYLEAVSLFKEGGLFATLEGGPRQSAELCSLERALPARNSAWKGQPTTHPASSTDTINES